MTEYLTKENILFTVQILSLFFLILYVIKTWHMASATKKYAEAAEKTLQEMKEMRDQETAPYVIVYFDLAPSSTLIYLVVKNAGKTIANGVKLAFNPPLKSSNQGVEMSDMPMIKYGIASLAPGQELRTFFDGAIGYFGREDLPLYITATVSYSGGLQPIERRYEQTLDLQAFKGLLYANEKDIGDLISQVENVAKACSSNNSGLQQITQTLRKGLGLDKGTQKKFGWRPKSSKRV